MSRVRRAALRAGNYNCWKSSIADDGELLSSAIVVSGGIRGYAVRNVNSYKSILSWRYVKRVSVSVARESTDRAAGNRNVTQLESGNWFGEHNSNVDRCRVCRVCLRAADDHTRQCPVTDNQEFSCRNVSVVGCVLGDIVCYIYCDCAVSVRRKVECVTRPTARKIACRATCDSNVTLKEIVDRLTEENINRYRVGTCGTRDTA